MHTVDIELYNALEEAKKMYDYDIDKILSQHYIPWDYELEPLNNLSHIELAKLLIDGYSLNKKEIYTDENMPVHFICEFNTGSKAYTADKHGNIFVVMWIGDNEELYSVTYDVNDMINWVNEGFVKILKIIE